MDIQNNFVYLQKELKTKQKKMENQVTLTLTAEQLKTLQIALIVAENDLYRITRNGSGSDFQRELCNKVTDLIELVNEVKHNNL